MQVAVLVHLESLIAFGNGEVGDGSILRRQLDDLVAVLRDQADERDVVLRSHGMQRAAHLDVHVRAVDAHHGHVLLDRGIGGIGSELGHLLATAHQRHARVERLDGDVAAVHALVELEIHGKSPFVV